MLKRFVFTVALCLGTASWAQAPLPAPSVDQVRRLTAEAKARAENSEEGGTDDVGEWQLLGSGYGELREAADGRAAFSVSLLRTRGDLSQLAIGLSRGSEAYGLTGRAELARFTLSPESSSWSAHVKYDGWLFERTASVWGGYTEVILGAADWRLAADTGTGRAEQTRGVLVMATSLGFSMRVTKQAGKNSLRLLTHVGVTGRSILGNAWSDQDFLREALGSPQRLYVGFEAGLFGQLNEVSFGVRFPLLMGRVAGLTNGQFLPSVSVGGAFDLSSLGDAEAQLKKKEGELAARERELDERQDISAREKALADRRAKLAQEKALQDGQEALALERKQFEARIAAQRAAALEERKNALERFEKELAERAALAKKEQELLEKGEAITKEEAALKQRQQQSSPTAATPIP
ncbi:hypothetical protein [Myxococcus sp. RHSTA-1-4]|uniref:hypothetical protein n=1 Tax=Myxococcus sp. RHSTA-1-4 TaxID=2874601 RepID=UPI001CBEC4B1|nr:hypothetical protein [Myxococcus sp. RHSTA-1-4]MBZ4418883.1 hypothetical protein [Myxococcus sp. RHSTA-1-4]